MAEKKHFEILGEMADKDLDISISDTVVNLTKVKRGGHITIGIDHSSFNKLMNNLDKGDKFHVQLLIVNAEQYDSIKNDKGTVAESSPNKA